ncbi:MAG: hypothetical protein D9V47_05540 [Clostridia bacterium]|nr:MAG: hypothetical protein D9V47_05540 [Clostridia bacterium]
MSWQRLLVCFELLSPVHIGFLPNQAGTILASTRCYVPGKSLWGAVTARLTPRLFKTPTTIDFRKVGDEIKLEVFFSYFYLSDGESIFNPNYTPEGLKWGNLSDKEFRGHFLGSHVSTTIEKVTGTAADESLHELEFIRHVVGSSKKPSQKVFMVGAVWVADGARIMGQPLQSREGSLFVGDVDMFEGITVGGERNYGFGRLKRIACTGTWVEGAGKLWEITPDQDIRLEKDRPLLAHLPYRQDCVFFGDIELLAGREYDLRGSTLPFRNPGAHVNAEAHYFVPGTRVQGAGVVRFDPWGRLIWKN